MGGEAFEVALDELDDDASSWWAEAKEEAEEDGAQKYQADRRGRETFLGTETLPWRRRSLIINEARPAIRA